MSSRVDYTMKDSSGVEVRKGDQVTVSFTGEVRSVSRDGLVVIKTSDGTFAAYSPQYQLMHKNSQ